MSPNDFNLGPSNPFETRFMNSLRSFLDLHNALTDHREGSGLTQREVAQTLGISQPAVSNFESNNSIATMISTLISYASTVGLEIEFTVKKAEYPDLPQA